MLLGSAFSVATIMSLWHRFRMNKKPKRPRDLNQLAYAIVQESTADEKPEPIKDTRNPAAVARGEKGGKARAETLSAKKRTAIAKKAAKARWKR